MSGAKEKRPQLDKLMEDARSGLIATVMVWRFDRFARSVAHLHKALDEFNQLKVHFISLTENVDTRTATGKMVFTVLGAVAEMERQIIIERVKAGLKRVARINPKTGKAENLGGWRPTKKDGSPRAYRGPKAPDPELLIKVNRLREKGLTLRGIAEEVDLSHTQVAKLLGTNR